MKKSYAVYIGLGIVAILLIVFMTKAKATAKALQNVDVSEAEPTAEQLKNRSILEKVNDISYDILFKWWYDPIFKTY